MRLLVSRMKKFFLKITGAAFLIGPPLIILLWGGFYFYSSITRLFHLKMPVQLSYKASGGTYLLKTDQLSFDVFTKQLKLKNSVLEDPRHRRIFSSQESLIRWNEKLDIDLKGVYVFIERSALGLSLKEAIPVSEEHAKPTPFSIHADVVDARYIDQLGQSLYETATLRKLHLDGFGQNWIAKAEVEMPKMGQFPFFIENSETRGIGIKMKLHQANAADILPHLKRWLPEHDAHHLKDVSFGFSSLTGPIWLVFPVGAIPIIYAQLKGELKEVNYKGILEKTSLLVDSTWGDHYLRADFEARKGAEKVHFNGAASWGNELGLAGQCDVFVSNEKKIPDVFRHTLPKNFHFKDTTLHSWISWSNFGPELVGTVVSKSADWNDQVAKELKTNIFLESQKLAAELTQGSWKGAKASGACRIPTIDASRERLRRRGFSWIALSYSPSSIIPSSNMVFSTKFRF